MQDYSVSMTLYCELPYDNNIAGVEIKYTTAVPNSRDAIQAAITAHEEFASRCGEILIKEVTNLDIVPLYERK